MSAGAERTPIPVMVMFVSASVAVLRERPDPAEELLPRVPPPDIYASGRFSGYVDLGGGRPGEQLADTTLGDA